MTDVTQVLSRIEKGDAHAAEQLLPLVYQELRQLAAQKLAHEKPGQIAPFTGSAMTSHRICFPAAAALAVAGLLAAAGPPDPPGQPRRENFVETVRAVTRPHAAEGQRAQEVRFEMVFVPGGEFTMGSPEGEAGREPAEGPRHRVRVGGFWVGRHEVTWDEYDLFMADLQVPLASRDRDATVRPPEDAVTRPSTPYVDETYGRGRAGHPVLSMTHHAAMVYCQWLRTKTGRAYRLPTEAEWEYAARGGTDAAYFFGDDPKRLGEYAWHGGNSRDRDNPLGTTHKVGTTKPNPFGLYDVLGNVAEWTLDQYDPGAYARRAKDRLSLRPVTVPTARKWSHVVRGGSWADPPDRCRSAARRVSDVSWQKRDPERPRSIWWLTDMDVVGFRVALAEDEQPDLVGLRPKVVRKGDD
jgi:formylglycine-generating enzyme required for sulfatase activity